MRQKKIIFSIIIVSLILSVLAYLAFQQTKHLKRDIPTLLNHYYQLEKTAPWKAKEALELIIAQDPDNITATRLLVFWYLRQGDTHSALEFLQKSHQRFPDDKVIRYELANLYILLNDPHLVNSGSEMIDLSYWRIRVAGEMFPNPRIYLYCTQDRTPLFSRHDEY